MKPAYGSDRQFRKKKKLIPKHTITKNNNQKFYFVFFSTSFSLYIIYQQWESEQDMIKLEMDRGRRRRRVTEITPFIASTKYFTVIVYVE